MVAALPGNIRLKLGQTLAQWRHWDCDNPLPAQPVVVSVLTAGQSNFSVLVESGDRFVVRIDGINPAAHSLNRQGEWHSLAAAHRAGLAPRPRYFNPELGSLVCDYLLPDPSQPLDIPAVANLMRGIHRLPARHQRLDLPERMLSYEKRLAHRNPSRLAQLAPCRPAVMEALADAGDGNHPLVLCHNDLLQANRVYSDTRLFALDWEYSAMGDAWYDLAVVVAGDALDAGAAEALLAAYLDRPVESTELHRVMQYGCAYRYLELLWYLAQDHAGPGEQQLLAKLALLKENLRQVQG